MTNWCSKDNLKALYWFEQAAKQGDKDAQYNTAVFYLGLFDTPKDVVKACDWFEKAAKQKFRG